MHVVPQDVILSNNPNGISVQAGGASVTYQVNVVSQGNYSGTVQLNCTAPTGLTCTGGSVTLPAGGSVSGTITVAASSTATVGNTSVMMSTTAGNSHTLTQAVNVTAVPTVSFGPDQYQTASYGTDAFYTITVNGNNWPAGRQVTLSKGSISNGLGATLYEGTTAAGSVITTKTITVPGSALFRITANIPPTQNSTNVYSASVKAVDTLTGADLGGTFLGITIVGSTPQAASLSVVSSLTVPVGGTVATAVGLTTSGTTTSSTQPSYTVSASTSGGGAVSLTPAGSTTTTANATIKVESPATATVLAGSLAVGSTFNVTFSGSAGSGLQAKTMQVKVVPLNQANPDDPTDGGAGLGRENTNDYVYNDGISSAPSKYYCVNCPKSTSCAVSDSLYVIDARQTPGIVVRPSPISINPDNSFQMTYLATSSVQPGVYWIHCFDTSRGINRSFPDTFSLNVLDAATKPVITSVCDAGVTASNCSEPVTTTGNIKGITINGTNLAGTSGANPVVRIWGPSGGPYTNSLDTQISTIAGSTRVDATVTVPDDANFGNYDVVIFPNGTTSFALGFLGQPSQPRSTVDSNNKLQVAVQLRLETLGTTISTDGLFYEDTTIRITALDGNGRVVTSFKGAVTISENAQNPMYNRQDGGVLPPTVNITSGGTATFVARSLASSSTGKPDDAQITAAFAAIKSNTLAVPQWVISRTPLDSLSSGPVYDWVQAMVKNMFVKNTTGDLADVLSHVSGYSIGQLTFNGHKVVGLTATAKAEKTLIQINPYNGSIMRGNGDPGNICGLPVLKAFENTVAHEARHAYQNYLSWKSDAQGNSNDQDGDFLPKVIDIAPFFTIEDSSRIRDVCDDRVFAQGAQGVSQSASFFGDSTKDDPDVIYKAVQYDAIQFAIQNVNRKPQ